MGSERDLRSEEDLERETRRAIESVRGRLDDLREVLVFERLMMREARTRRCGSNRQRGENRKGSDSPDVEAGG